MRVLSDVNDVPAELHGGVILLGNFDGVHRGHQAVIGYGTEIAQPESLPVVVVTFEPHPRSLFRPDDPPFRLTPARNKRHHLEALEVDGLVELVFDAAFSRIGAEAFVQSILVDGLGARHVVIGHDFRFGHKRQGTPELLQSMGASQGFAVTVLEPVASADSEVYSSTRIRDYLRTGKPGHAAALLGRPFEIEARVLEGDKRGRTIGFPTANLSLGDYLRPAYGVYAVRAGVENGNGSITWRDGIANLGKRPTVDGVTELFEVHLFDFDEDIYGRILRAALIEYIRPEQKFDGLEALKAQISHACLVAHRILTTRAAGGRSPDVLTDQVASAST